MPRYIDADKLIDKIFPIGLIDDGNYTINAKAVKVAIDKMPTADVVPKSEVEKLRFNLEAVLEEIPETKREVAREIFEEIEELDIQLNNGDLDIKYFGSAIAELKNKYTESEDNE